MTNKKEFANEETQKLILAYLKHYRKILWTCETDNKKLNLLLLRLEKK